MDKYQVKILEEMRSKLDGVTDDICSILEREEGMDPKFTEFVRLCTGMMVPGTVCGIVEGSIFISDGNISLLVEDIDEENDSYLHIFKDMMTEEMGISDDGANMNVLDVVENHKSFCKRGSCGVYAMKYLMYAAERGLKAKVSKMELVVLKGFIGQEHKCTLGVDGVIYVNVNLKQLIGNEVK